MLAWIVRLLGLPAWVLACVALVAPAPASADGPGGSPSAKQLWKAYPLKPRQQSPGAAASTTPARSGAASSSSGGSGGGGSGGVPVPLLGLLALALAGAAGALAWARSRASVRPPQMPALLGPAPALSGGPAATTLGGPRGPEISAAWRRRRSDNGRSAGSSAPGIPRVDLRPPDPDREWSAEIEWQHGDNGSRFCVFAAEADGSHRVPVAQSVRLEWPPTDSAAVQAMSDATLGLEDALVAAGWQVMPPGKAWYAKRFRWQPASSASTGATFARPASAETESSRARRAAETAAAAAPRRPSTSAPAATPSEAPAAQPPTSAPAAAATPDAQPPTPTPAATETPDAQPPTSAPAATETPDAQPPTSTPAATETPDAQPPASEPASAEPLRSAESASEPVATEPSGWKPPAPESGPSSQSGEAAAASPSRAPSTRVPRPAAGPRRPASEPPGVNGPGRATPERPDATGRFRRSSEWPKGADSLWRCELAWEAGYLNSRFQAVAHPPGQQPSRVIGSSSPFKWMFMDNPDPRGARYLAEVRGLTAALESAGWERVGRGPAWYAERFVWRRDGAPPDRVDPASAKERGGS